MASSTPLLTDGKLRRRIMGDEFEGNLMVCPQLLYPIAILLLDANYR
jgi:hypothetical protein